MSYKQAINDSWVKDISKELCDEAAALVLDQKFDIDTDSGNGMLFLIVKDLIAQVVLESLNRQAERNTKQFEAVSQELVTSKTIVQEAVGLAFTEALSKFSGMHTPYFCYLALAPENTGMLLS